MKNYNGNRAHNSLNDWFFFVSQSVPFSVIPVLDIRQAKGVW
jgi:hypothetical protein